MPEAPPTPGGPPRPALSGTPEGSALREAASAPVASGSPSSPFPAESARRALCRNMAQFELTLTWGCLEKRKQCPLRESGWASSAPTLTGLCPLWVSAFILIQCRGWDKSVCTNRRLVRAQGLPKSSLLSFSRLVFSDSLWPHGLQHNQASLSFAISQSEVFLAGDFLRRWWCLVQFYFIQFY